MKECLMVFLGGGAGSVCRYWLSAILRPLAHQGFPLATFVVNLLGCFCIGIFYGLSARLNWSAETRLLLTTGFCGGFTTFSTFSYEGLALLRQGQWGMYALYVLLSVALGLACAWLGNVVVK